MNKIIKLDINKHIKTIARKGGLPKFEIPNSINNLKKMYSDLKEINKSLDSNKKIVILIHKDKDSDSKISRCNEYIPAISNRLTSLSKVIFGCEIIYKNNFLYEKAKNYHVLSFVYELSYDDVEGALQRLSDLIKFIENNTKNMSIKDFVEILASKKINEKHQVIQNLMKIKNNEDNNFKYLTATSIYELICKTESFYDTFKIIEKAQDSNIQLSEAKMVVFSSSSAKEKALQKLKNQNITITYDLENILFYRNNKVIEWENEIFQQNDIKISNFLVKDNPKNYNQDILNELNKVQKNNINVGVVDSDISKNSLIFEMLTFCYYEPKLSDDDYSHSEQVCSILLFANKLDSKLMGDNCFSPNIYLFNIIDSNMYVSEFFKEFEKILLKYGDKIKIWNLSFCFQGWRNTNSWKYGISSYGHLFDVLQKKYQVIFIIASGNKDKCNTVIESPADSVFGLSISAAFDTNKIPPYALSGDIKNNKFYSVKPDFATTGCDSVDFDFAVISSNSLSRSMGTSFAAPLITRKVAQLLFNDIQIQLIPAILSAFAAYKTKNTINDFWGNGIISMDINEILKFKDSGAILIFEADIEGYKNAFLDISLPKNKMNNYDYSFFMGINCEANINNNYSFEHVVDSIRVQFGAVDPISDGENKPTRLIQTKKLKTVFGDDDGAYTKETDLRKLYDKYKNRYVQTWIRERSIGGEYKHLDKKGQIEKWGFSLVRNDLMSRRHGNMKVHICLIIENIKHNDIYQELRNQNQKYINAKFSEENIILIETSNRNIKD